MKLSYDIEAVRDLDRTLSMSSACDARPFAGAIAAGQAGHGMQGAIGHARVPEMVL
jgi:hypothetical protein